MERSAAVNEIISPSSSRVIAPAAVSTAEAVPEGMPPEVSAGPPTPESYSLAEAALLIGVSVATLCRLIRAGRLPAILSRSEGGGEYRVPAFAVIHAARAAREGRRLPVIAVSPPIPFGETLPDAASFAGSAPVPGGTAGGARGNEELLELLRRELQQVKRMVEEKDNRLSDLEEQERARTTMLQIQLEQSLQAQAELRDLLRSEQAERVRMLQQAHAAVQAALQAAPRVLSAPAGTQALSARNVPGRSEIVPVGRPGVRIEARIEAKTAPSHEAPKTKSDNNTRGKTKEKTTRWNFWPLWRRQT